MSYNLFHHACQINGAAWFTCVERLYWRCMTWRGQGFIPLAVRTSTTGVASITGLSDQKVLHSVQWGLSTHQASGCLWTSTYIYIYIKVPRFWHRSYSIICLQMWHFRTEHEDNLYTWLNLFTNTMHDPAWWEAPLSKTKVPPGQNHLSLEELTIINWEWNLISRWWIVGETKLCIPSIRADKWF
jgi:hypothetical protein